MSGMPSWRAAPIWLRLDSPASLRIARQQLHQAVGALEMVGLSEPLRQVLRSDGGRWSQKFVQRPELCSGCFRGQQGRARQLSP
jgi:hypothetical protein